MNSEKLILNDIEYCITESGKKIEHFNNDAIVNQFITMNECDRPATNITPRLIRKVMNEMAWPPMGKTQAFVNKNALTSYNAVVRYFKKEHGSMTNIDRNEAEAQEAIKVVLHTRLFRGN